MRAAPTPPRVGTDPGPHPMIGWAITAGAAAVGFFVLQSWRKDAAIKSG